MNAPSAIETLQRQGVRLRRIGDKLHLWTAAPELPPDALALAREHKQELLRLLPDSATLALRATLRRLAIQHGLPLGIVERMPDSDLEPANCAHLLTEAGLLVWLRMLRDDAAMLDGIVPPDWTHQATCARCGPIWHWVPGDHVACPWCAVRESGRAVPHPA